MKAGPTPKVPSGQRIKPTTIVVVDDHEFMRELICTTLAQQSSRYTVLGEARNAAEAIAACQELTPQLVILDINLPDRSGLEIVPEIKRVSSASRVLLCTAFATEDRIQESIQAGADGFVEKTHTWGEFLDAVDRVSKGERYFRSTSPCAPPSPQTFDPALRVPKFHLSPREREVLTLIAQGSTSKEIANKLFISALTVETHRANLMSKLDVHNVAGLVLFAVRHGLVTVPVDE